VKIRYRSPLATSHKITVISQETDEEDIKKRREAFAEAGRSERWNVGKTREDLTGIPGVTPDTSPLGGCQFACASAVLTTAAVTVQESGCTVPTGNFAALPRSVRTDPFYGIPAHERFSRSLGAGCLPGVLVHPSDRPEL
jgi:hypothetical protein